MNRADVASGTASPELARNAVVMPAIVAMLLGVFLIWGVGFAHPEIIHNAAHDSRHAFSFPCH